MANSIFLELTMDDRGTPVIRNFSKQAERSLDRAASSHRRFAYKAVGHMKRFQNRATSSVGKVFKALTSLQGLLIGGGLIAGFLKLGASSVTAASDVEEMESKFRAVFKGLSGGVDEWASVHAKAVNRSALELKGYLSTLQDTFVPMGFARDKAAELSKATTKLAVDLSSFNNVATADVVRDLQSALVGNTETVRKYGVVITQATLNQQLLRSGIDGGVKSATEAQKTFARLQIIMNSTKDAQGDAAKTAGDYANEVRGLKGVWQEVLVFFGQGVIPAIKDLIRNTIRPAAERMREWAKQNQELINVNVAEWLGKIVTVGGKVKNLIENHLPKIGTFIADVGKGWALLPGPIKTLGLVGGILLGKGGTVAIVAGLAALGKVSKFVEDFKKSKKELEELAKTPLIGGLLVEQRKLQAQLDRLGGQKPPGMVARLKNIETALDEYRKLLKPTAEATHFAADKLGDFGDEAVKAARKLRAIPAAAGEAAEKTKEIFGTTGMEILAARSRQAREFLGFMDQETEATDLSAQERFDIRVRENERIARLYAQRGKEYQRHFARPVKKSARELLADQRKQLNGASASFGTLWSAVQLGAPKPIRTCRTSACWPLTRRSRLSER